MNRHMRKVYDIWLTKYACPEPLRRYPDYKVEEVKIGSASTLEKGEELIRSYIGTRYDSWNFYDSFVDHHSFHIVATPMDRYSVKDGDTEAYQYDADGKRLASRTLPFVGRNPEECMFRPGDLVEVVTPTMAYLAAVLITPPPRTPNGTPHIDSDTYWVVNRHGVELEVDTLKMFTPSRKVHPKMREWFRTAVAEYKSRPVTRKIESAAGEARLGRMLSDAGLYGKVRGIDIVREYYTVDLQGIVSGKQGPGIEKEFFTVDLHGVLGTGEDSGCMTVKVGRKALDRHPEMVEVFFRRLAGGHPEGKGYRARVESYDPDNPFSICHDVDKKYYIIG